MKAIKILKSRIIYFLLCYLMYTNINAQTWTNYLPADGLINNGIYDIDEDLNGNIWFSSWNSNFESGLVKYDGVNWTQYTTADGLSSNEINEVIVDNDGNIWCATTQDGISVYDGVNWTIISQLDGLIGNSINAIYIDNNNNIWVTNSESGGDYGISVYDGVSWTNYLNIAGRSIKQAPNGDIWVGGFFGVYQFDGSTWTNYTTDDGLSTNNIYVIEFDSNGNLWAGNPDNIGLDRFDGNTWTTYTTEDGLVDNNVRAIISDSNNELWFATNEGVSIFNGTDWITLNTDDGMVGNIVRSLLQDSTGAYWIGVFPQGVSKYEPALAIESFNSTINFNIFPNPAISTIQLDYPSDIEITDLIIINVQGQKYPVTLLNKTIDVSNLSTGLYFITIETNKGVITKKFIKN